MACHEQGSEHRRDGVLGDGSTRIRAMAGPGPLHHLRRQAHQATTPGGSLDHAGSTARLKLSRSGYPALREPAILGLVMASPPLVQLNRQRPAHFIERKPSWLKVPAPGGPNYLALKHLMRDLKLHTVC